MSEKFLHFYFSSKIFAKLTDSVKIQFYFFLFVGHIESQFSPFIISLCLIVKSLMVSIQFDFFDVNIFIRLIFSFNFKRFSIFKIQSCILHAWTSDLIFIRTLKYDISCRTRWNDSKRDRCARKSISRFLGWVVGLTCFAKLSNIWELNNDAKQIELKLIFSETSFAAI